MSTEESSGSARIAPAPVAPPPSTEPRKPGWWAWPLVVLCLVPVERVAGRFAGDAPERIEAAAETETGDLALLKLQSQVVIATGRLDPGAAEEARDDLFGAVRGDRAFAALALLEEFVEPGSGRAEKALDRLSDRAPAEFADLVRRAARDGVDEEDRAELRRRLGWFAGLARGPGRAPPPAEREIRSRSSLVLMTMGLAITGAILALLCGAGLLVLHLRRVQGGAPGNAFQPATRNGGVFLECFALYLGLMVSGPIAGIWLGEAVAIGAYAAAVAVPLLWPWLRGVRWREFRREAGLHPGRGWLREVAAGCVGYLGVLAIASIGIFLTLVLTFLAGLVGGGSASDGGAAPGPEVHPIVGWFYEGDLWTRLACLALAAGFAPVFEEIFFRGALQRYLRARFRFLPSALIGSVIFAALHPQGFFAIPALAGIGVGFALLREWRDSLIAPMTAHAINNGCLVGMLWWVL